METNVRGHPLIFKCLTGSRAYGTNLPESDFDYKGVYIQANTDILGGYKYVQQIDVGKDETYWELERFIKLAATANPTVLEIMFTDNNIICEDPIWQMIKNNRQMFLTKNCLRSFGGYVQSQIVKATGLQKKVNWKKEDTIRKTPIDFCYYTNNSQESIPLSSYLSSTNLEQEFCGLSKLPHFADTYCLFYDWSAHYGKQFNKPIEPIGYRGVCFEDSNSIRLSSIPKGQEIIGYVCYNQNEYSKHCADYLSYQEWLENANQSRYIKTVSGSTIDGKNMLHCVRLLTMAKEIVTERRINVYREIDRDYLLAIRKGEVELSKLVEKSRQDLIDLNQLYENSDLPESVDAEILHNLILNVRLNYGRKRK